MFGFRAPKKTTSQDSLSVILKRHEANMAAERSAPRLDIPPAIEPTKKASFGKRRVNVQPQR
jgi:hypothetical protein